MQEVIEDVQRIIHISKVSTAAWDSFDDKRKDQLKAGLAMSCNHAIVCLELLDHYVTHWKGSFDLASSEIVSLKQENGGRVIMATKGLFLFSISAIEFSMKHALRLKAQPLSIPKKKIKFFNLIEESYDKKIISIDNFNYWRGVINIRNSVVHNNGIWEDEDKVYKYPNGLLLNLKNESMIRGNLRVFSQLTEWTLSAYIQWSVFLMLSKKY